MLQSDERFFQETEIGGKTVMRKAGALICVIIMTVLLMAPAAFAAEDGDSAAAAKTDLEIVSSSPEDGATGVAVDNLSVKIRFNKDVYPKSDEIKAANAKQFKLVDSGLLQRQGRGTDPRCGRCLFRKKQEHHKR